MSKAREMAERLLQAERGPNPSPYSPLSQPYRLDDLWPIDRQRYIKMAEAALGIRDDR